MEGGPGPDKEELEDHLHRRIDRRLSLTMAVEDHSG